MTMCDRKKIRSLAADEGGYVMLLAAFMLPVLLGIAALALDVAKMESEGTRAQSAADSAALTAAAAAQSTPSQSMSDKIKAGQTEGYAVAQFLSYLYPGVWPSVTTTTTGLGANIATTTKAQCSASMPATGDYVCVGTPPQYGRYRNQSGYWEAVIRKKPPLFLGALTSGENSLFGNNWWVYGHAVVGGTSPCVVILDWRGTGDGHGALTDSGNTQIRADCGIYVNSESTSGILMQGNAELCATLVSVAGNYATVGNGGGINPSSCLTSGGTFYGHIKTGGQQIADPFSSLDNATRWRAPSSIASKDCFTSYQGSGSTQFFRRIGNPATIRLVNPKSVLPADCVYNDPVTIDHDAYLDGSIYYFTKNVTLQGKNLGGYGTISLGTSTNADDSLEYAHFDTGGSYTFNLNRPAEPQTIPSTAVVPPGYTVGRLASATGWNKDFVIFQSGWLDDKYANYLANTPYEINGTPSNQVFAASFRSTGVFNSSGAIYTPRGGVFLAAGGVYQTGCTLFIVYRLYLQGSPNLGNSCGVPYPIAGIGKGKLVDNGF